MQQGKRIVLALMIVLVVSLVGALPVAVAGAPAASHAAPLASFQADEDPGKGDKGKGNDNNGKGNNGKGNNGKGNNGNAGKGNPGGAGLDSNPPGRGLDNWLRAFRARWFDAATEEDFGGWQLGRFKEAFPFAHPQGWQARERGDALVLAGPWQGGDFLFQLTRTVQVNHASLRDWVATDLRRLGVSGDNARFVDLGRTQVAVVVDVNDAGYDCPVAYMYLWTQNPAGNNQRQAMGVLSQAPGAACDTAGLRAFVDQYLARVGQGQRPLPLVTPTAPVPTPTRSAPTATPAGTGWQQTRFFNAFSFSYPSGWAMDRLGDTAHLQGDYEGRAYVMDVVWVRNTAQGGLEQWVRADLNDLGVAEGARIDYAQQGTARIAVVPGVRLPGYACHVVRFYVVADNPAGDGPRAFAGILAQANGQACNPAALENLAYQMLQQA